MSMLQEDALLRPDLFQWNGAIPEKDLERWLADRSLRVHRDLQRFWLETGGGELFETETMLSPSDDADPGSDIECVNRLHWEQGLSTGYLIFQVGAFGLSAIRLLDHTYVLLDEATYTELAEFEDLEHWYCATIRYEYAQRYGLGDRLTRC